MTMVWTVRPKPLLAVRAVMMLVSGTPLRIKPKLLIIMLVSEIIL